MKIPNKSTVGRTKPFAELLTADKVVNKVGSPISLPLLSLHAVMPNGPALSCGADKFRNAQSESSLR
jgi:hypothetical protein